MGTEILEKKESEYLYHRYFQERVMVIKSGVVDILKEIFHQKGEGIKKFSIEETPPEKGKYLGRYLVDVTWVPRDFSDENFCKALLITADSKKNTIMVSGEVVSKDSEGLEKKELVIKKEEWVDKKGLKEKIIKIYQNPASRANVPFTDDFKE